MTGAAVRLADALSVLLERDEREAARGDLSESGECAWSSLIGIFGLVARRQAQLWRSWRPWLAAWPASSC